MHAIEKQLLWRRIIRGVGLALGLLVQTAGANEVQSDIFVARSTLELTEPAEVLKCRPNRTEAESMIKICALRPSGPYSVTIELKNGWKFLDNATVQTVECQLTEEVFIGVVRGSEGFQLLYLCDSDHVNTMELEAEDVWAHRIFLYPNGKPGVVVEPQDIKWKCVENAYHRRTGQIPFNTYQLKTGYVCRPIADDGVKPVVENGIFSKGHYEEDYTADWTWRGCETDECRTHAVFEAEADVYRLSLVNGAKSGTAAEALGLGLDMTDAGKAENRGSTFPIEAVIEDEYEHKKEFRWSVGKIRQDKEFTTESVINLEVEREEKEPHLPTLFGKNGPVESERLTCEARISGCHETCVAEATVSTNVTVVGVDVTIEMADCEKKTDTDKLLGYAWSESEKIEETQGAFIHYEDDHGMKPFSPRGSNALVRVWFTVKPDNLPKDDKVRLSFPEGALWEGTQRRGNAFYTPAEKEYTVSKLKNKSFYLHGHKPSEKICDHEITIEHVKSGAKDCAKYTVVELDLVPDFDRDHKIDADDEKKVVQQKMFYWWINDDDDEGNCANCLVDEGHDVPGKGRNHKDGSVNGRTDLLDFFPLWTKMGRALGFCRNEDYEDQELEIRLVISGLGCVMTQQVADRAGMFLNTDGKDVNEELLCEAEVSSDTELSFKSKNWLEDKLDIPSMYGEGKRFKKYVEQISGAGSKQGVLLVEGRETGAAISLQFCRKAKTLFSVEFKPDLRSVMDMMAQLDLYGEKAAYKPCPIKDPDYQPNETMVFYLHGFKVSKDYSKGWNADAFKRLYQSQSNAKFVGVAWPGRYEKSSFPGLHYHKSAEQAFACAKKFADFYEQEKLNAKRTVLMAHSLGNMLVSSAIQDYDVRPTAYFMLNGAVASEAYDAKRYRANPGDTQHLIYPEWYMADENGDSYPLMTYSTEWHKLFVDGTSEADKSRAALTWINRFDNVPVRTKMYNFYSLEDEVFEINKGEDFWQGTGARLMLKEIGPSWAKFLKWVDVDAARYCWQKQEIGKGIECLNFMGDSDMGGWGFNPRPGATVAQAEGDNNMRWYPRHMTRDLIDTLDTRNKLKRNPVFNVKPENVFKDLTSVLSKDLQNKMLCDAIPVISTAMGRTSESGSWIGKDMNDYRSRWGRNDKTYDAKWLHCDLKDMAYFYTYKLWDEFVELGSLN